MFRDGKVVVDAVFSTCAGDAWILTHKARVDGVSIWAAGGEFHRGASGRLVTSTLVSVDLVRSPADKQARITAVVEGATLTPGQRSTQTLFDQYLANPCNPRAHNIFAAAESRGIEALDVLAPVVAPLVAERAARLGADVVAV